MTEKHRLQVFILAGILALGGALGFGAYQLAQESPRPVDAAPAEADLTPTTATIPAELPDFVLADTNNKPRSIQEWQGKSLILNFWATWCPPCRREIPLLKSVHAERSAQNFQVIGIAVDTAEAVRAYAAKQGMKYPLLVGEQESIEVAQLFGVASVGLPFTVFTDDRGRIVSLNLGELHAAELNGILDAVHAVNQGALDLEQARTKITELEQAARTR